ncbi:MAG: hypothetical protein LQ338_001196 [Usnochroma carphineum]|nr:MAG: hypothetical protein LQ338_001196 [Usnochroma carphineum]
MGAEQDSNKALPSSKSNPDTNNVVKDTPFKLKRRSIALARYNMTNRVSPRQKASEITNRISTLMDERANLLGISKLSAEMKKEIIEALNGKELLTKEAFDNKMHAEILATRITVLTAMSQDKSDTLHTDLRAEVARLETRCSELNVDRAALTVLVCLIITAKIWLPVVWKIWLAVVW